MYFLIIMFFLVFLMAKGETGGNSNFVLLRDCCFDSKDYCSAKQFSKCYEKIKKVHQIEKKEKEEDSEEDFLFFFKKKKVTLPIFDEPPLGIEDE